MLACWIVRELARCGRFLAATVEGTNELPTLCVTEILDHDRSVCA